MAMQAESARKKLVVLGNGMAAGRVLEELFARAPDRYDVTIFGAEPRVNYDRIMLSPVLAGEKAFDDIIVHDDAWYAQHKIDLRKGEPIVAIDRAQRTVRTEAGKVVSYDTLIIATGSKPILIPVPGAELPGVVTFRDLDDVDAMLAAAARGGNAVVIGGGLLGLEAAAGLADQGHEDDGRAPDADLDGAPARSERRVSPAARDREARHRDPHRRQHPGDHRRRGGEGGPARRRPHAAGRSRGDGGRHSAERAARQGCGPRGQARPRGRRSPADQ